MLLNKGMLPVACGIDFGTSNSSIALTTREGVRLVPVEEPHLTIPSAIFFPQPGSGPCFGRAALERFLAKQPGRYMRSMKRLLGSSLFKQGTLIQGKLMPFEQIIALFLQQLKDKASGMIGTEVENVVLGRPVHFVDHDPQADQRAQDELQAIAQSIGFKHIAFQYEPIAAAFAHEVHISEEKLALVVDLGGGTSDFTIIKLSAQFVQKQDRSSDILANTGIRVGGNDFDKNLSLTAVMPYLGYKSTYGEKNLPVPLKLYHDLSEWSRINFLYTLKNRSLIGQLLNQSADKKRLSRLLRILETETGHALLGQVEELKIALTHQKEHTTSFGFQQDKFALTVSQTQFEDAIRSEVEKITLTALACLQQAGVKKQAIDLVILTGGTTEVPLMQATFKNLFPQAAFMDENKLSSVGLGLAYDSQKKFG